ncbi:MAG: class I SAM-dependent methyltransferase [archaeon]|nr:class I SAM-dependent methyltransferase [archaeon]
MEEARIGRYKKEKILSAFDEVVEFYDEYMEQTDHVQAQKEIADKLKEQIIGGDFVLDVATGTGVMIQPFERAIGVDASSKMIESAKRKYPDKDFCIADVEHLPFKDNTFDYAMSCLAFLWFIDRERSLAEMLRVSRRGIFIIEEEGVPARQRIEIPDHLKPFFELIEKLEEPIDIEKWMSDMSGFLRLI